VVWRPGELDEELKRGAWYVLDLEPGLVLRKKTAGLWQELVQRAEIRDKAI
jgi:putative transcriptional regulator